MEGTYVYTDLMIDMETMGTTADSVILALGAVRFDAWNEGKISDEGFYCVFDIQSQLSAGRHMSEDTLQWWLKQSPEAQGVFFAQGKVSLDDGLQMFVDWVKSAQRETHPWSMGADFDLPMLSHALATRGFEIPWNFWDSNCVRTYKKLPGADEIYQSVSRLGTHHNALHDAIHQAKAVQAINKALWPKQTRRPTKARRK